MRPPGPPLPQRHLQPGDMLITQEPQWVITLLGSCVAVTMFSVRFRLAAICHAMLPQPHGKDPQCSPQGDCLRYLSHVIPAMAERFTHAGLQPKEVEVKMFGGGNVIQMGSDSQREFGIGSDNVAIAERILKELHFRVAAKNVGGFSGCKIMFNTHSGEVLHRHLSRGTFNPRSATSSNKVNA